MEDDRTMQSALSSLILLLLFGSVSANILQILILYREVDESTGVEMSA